jgi:hypothetical protein
VIDRLRRRFAIGRVCVVADRGMISDATIAGQRNPSGPASLQESWRNITGGCAEMASMNWRNRRRLPTILLLGDQREPPV